MRIKTLIKVRCCQTWNKTKKNKSKKVKCRYRTTKWHPIRWTQLTQTWNGFIFIQDTVLQDILHNVIETLGLVYQNCLTELALLPTATHHSAASMCTSDYKRLCNISYYRKMLLFLLLSGSFPPPPYLFTNGILRAERRRTFSFTERSGYSCL